MTHLNVEIKARCLEHDKIRRILRVNGADFKGIDHQIDTYFKVNSGRLKIREGTIENFLVFYKREDKADPKKSKVILFENDPSSTLKEILMEALESLVVVDKKREIYFIGNVKFHMDTVKGLGTFIEIEAIDNDGTIGEENLLKQCQYYLQLFDIKKAELISVSYSDLLLQRLVEANLTR